MIKRESDHYCRKVNISIQKLRVDTRCPEMGGSFSVRRRRLLATLSAFLLRKLSIKQRSYI